MGSYANFQKNTSRQLSQLPPTPQRHPVALKALSWTPGARTRDDDFQWLGFAKKDGFPNKKKQEIFHGWKMNLEHKNGDLVQMIFNFWIYDPTITLRETSIASENGWLELE